MQSHDADTLEIGAFYWVLLASDPDAEEWEKERMPARYEGGGKWRYLGVEGVSDWPVSWVGPRISDSGQTKQAKER